MNYDSDSEATSRCKGNEVHTCGSLELISPGGGVGEFLSHWKERQERAEDKREAKEESAAMEWEGAPENIQL